MVPLQVARLVAAVHPVALAVVLGGRLNRDRRAGRARPRAVGIGVVDVYGQPLRVGAADRQRRPEVSSRQRVGVASALTR